VNTPRLVADATGTTVWRWDQAEPFGNNPADHDPDGNSIAFDLPLRLPGQRYDAETALHYNYFRDYDPSIGRYGESDPIGLDGGLNTYAYGLSNPVLNIDSLGLDVTVTYYPGGPGHIGIGINSSETVGLYPVQQTTAMMTCSTVAGAVVRDRILQKPKDIAGASSLVIKTAGWQDTLMQDYIYRMREISKPAYNLCVNQCQSFVDAVLGAGGVGRPDSPGPGSFPSDYYDALQQMYGGQRRK